MAAHRNTRKPLTRTQFLGSVLPGSAAMAMGLLAFSGAALADSANPWADISAVSGSISKDLSVANVNTITQHTDRTVTTASSADILSNQTVNILQNNNGSLFVLKTTGADQDGAQIHGALNANGRVMVLDRNGVFFGANSRIDVGGIVASTGDVDNDAVMRGDTTLTLKDFGDAAVVNDGLISVSGSGLAALVAPQVVNNGIIQARLGKVALASGGESATVDLYGDGLVELAVGGKTGKALAENAGVIEGSTVLMTASGAKEIVDTVINMSGVINATSATVQGGKIILGGGNAGKVKVSGVINASDAAKGGSVSVTGEDLEVTQDAFVMADATANGDGGNIYFMAENNALYEGQFSARGGATGGNGGFVELSAGNQVGYNGSVNTSAANGVGGSFLIDPLFAVIHSGWLNNVLGLEYVLSAQALANDLRYNGSVIVQADHYINVGTDMSLPLGSIDNGPINLQTWEDTVYGGFFSGCFFGCPISGTTLGSLTLQSDVVNFNRDLTLGQGDLHVLANTVNLNARLYDINGLLNQGDITSTASLVKVLSDSALIQQGIYLAANNATVNVAAGSYNESVNVNKTLTLLGANAGIAGNGVRGAETVVSPNSPGFHVTADGVIIDGFMITGASGADGYGVWVDNADNADIKNNVINSSAQSGVQFTNAHNGAATLNKITTSGDSGIRLDNSHNVTASNNDISLSGIDGIRAFGSNFLTANNNDIYNVGGSGIGIQNSNNASFDGNKITSVNRGFWIGSSDDVAVLNSEIVNAGTGIRILDASNRVQVKGNQITGGFNAVLVLDNSSDIDIGDIGAGESNTITGTGGTAVATIDSNYIRIINNIINGAADDGISITRGGNLTIQLNEVDNINDTAILTDNVANLVIDQNRIGQGAGVIGNNGIHVVGSSGTQIHGNIVSATNTGIYAQNTAHLNVGTVLGNTVTGGKNGIRVENASGSLWIRNNTTSGASDTPAGRAAAYLTGIGILVADSTGMVNVVDNNASNNMDGIRILRTHGANVDGNTTNANSDKGIIINRSNNVDVTDNDANLNTTGIWVELSNNATLDGNNITNSLADGVHLRDSVGTLVTNNDILGNAGNGIWVERSSDTEIYNNDLTGSSTGIGVKITGGDNITVGGALFLQGNTIDQFRDGIIADAVNGLTVKGNLLTGTASGTGIGAYNSNNVMIGGDGSPLGFLEANGVLGFHYGIHAQNSDGAEIVQNLLLSNENGIRVSDSDSVRLYQNAIGLTGWDAIQIVDGSEDARVEENLISGAGASGIAVMNGAHNALLSGNIINGVDRLGVYVWNSNDLTIRNNTITNTGLAGGPNWYLSGIHLEGSNNTLIANNDISGTGGDGVHIGGSGNQAAQATSGNIIRNNRISDTDGDGIEVVDSDGIIIRINDILDAGGQGVFVNNSDGARINGNTITNVLLDGVKLEAGDDVIVGGNTIQNSGRVGIYSSKTTNLLIRNNTLDMTTFAIGSPYGAITTEQGANITIAGNTTTNSGHGIQMMWVDGVNEIRNNTINATANNGIHAEDVENLTISANEIGLLGGVSTIKGHGIHVSVSDGVQILGNKISNTVKRGINLHLGALATIKNNILDKIGQEGVRTEQIHGLDVRNNDLTNIGWNGMDIQGGSNVTLHNNMLDKIGGRGMHVAGAQIATTVTGNDISNTGESGIVVNGTKDTLIRNNLIHTIGTKNNADYSGIDAKNVTDGLRIVNNHIGYTDRIGTEGGVGNIKHIGISVTDSDRAVLRDNMLTMSKNGVVLDGNNRVRLVSNVINNSGANGLYAMGQDNGRIVLIGNEFNDNTTGAQFESGEIDLTGAANMFNGGTVGMRFDPTPAGDPLKLSLVGNTIGTTEFTGQSQYYAQLANGAFFAPGTPTVLNALNASYEGFSPSSVGGILTLAQYNALESKFFHYNDNPTLGLFFFGAVPFAFDDSDIYNSYGAYAWANGRFRMTILSLPHLPGAPVAGAGTGGQPSFAGNIADFLANIAPAAGGDGPANLASIEPAAGNNVEAATCWSDAISQASAGTAVSYSFGGTNEEALNQTATCGSAL